jgi:hypothetical protein
MTPLISDQQQAQLLRHGVLRAENPDFDPWPVVKLFTPDANATWLLTELDPDDPDIAFGLCDLGLGCPELGHVRLTEIRGVRGPFGLPVERDRFFRPQKPISVYACEALGRGHIET